jgi:hypothetical protein
VWQAAQPLIEELAVARRRGGAVGHLEEAHVIGDGVHGVEVDVGARSGVVSEAIRVQELVRAEEVAHVAPGRRRREVVERGDAA